MNAGIVKKGDAIEYERADGTVVSTIAQEDRVFNVPTDTIYATVNGHTKIDLRIKTQKKRGLK
jgi:hypothetical protein